jgi:hypothetical protein
VVPSITCDANPEQSYALYLPSNFSPDRKWPIVYIFDPAARGPLAVDTLRAAAEKFDYILAASNNSRNGPLGGSGEAANAVWVDTHKKLPIDEHRRYAAGLSGGARVAVGVALACRDCMAGVIANSAGFPSGLGPTPDMKFVFFGAVGDSDFNYPEFATLRGKLRDAGSRFRIRVFHGDHGWAPPEVWLEALNWLDLQAMALGTLAHDARRIQDTFDQAMARAQQFRSHGNLVETAREYRFIVRDFSGLADASAAQVQLADMEKDKALRKAEKDEADAVSYQEQLASDISSQMQSAGSQNMPPSAWVALRDQIADLKKKATAPGNATAPRTMAMRRALVQVTAEASESGQGNTDLKNYAVALQYFDLAAAGSWHPEWPEYQRARVYALQGDKKGVLTTLKRAIELGLNNPSLLQAEEFARYRDLPQFQALVAEIKTKPAQ